VSTSVLSVSVGCSLRSKVATSADGYDTLDLIPSRARPAVPVPAAQPLLFDHAGTDRMHVQELSGATGNLGFEAPGMTPDAHTERSGSSGAYSEFDGFNGVTGLADAEAQNANGPPLEAVKVDSRPTSPSLEHMTFITTTTKEVTTTTKHVPVQKPISFGQWWSPHAATGSPVRSPALVQPNEADKGDRFLQRLVAAEDQDRRREAAAKLRRDCRECGICGICAVPRQQSGEVPLLTEGEAPPSSSAALTPSPQKRHPKGSPSKHSHAGSPSRHARSSTPGSPSRRSHSNTPGSPLRRSHSRGHGSGSVKV